MTVVSSQYLEDRGLTNVADALNEQPGFRGSITPNGSQGSFGQGVNFVNGYGLGSNRTLTLVNGRRFVSSNPNTLFNQGSQGTQVDLNVINSLLVDRVETISIGGAPVYGSDAIAGTVNVILKDRYKGVNLQGVTGVSDYRDGFRYSLSGIAGSDFLDGRLNVTVAFQHDKQNGVLANDRDYLRANLGGATNPCPGPVSSSCSAANYIGNLNRPAGVSIANDGRVNTDFGLNASTTDGNPGTIQIRDVRISVQ